MSELSERFRELVARGDLRPDVKVVYRISGGMPEESIEEEFRLSGSSEAESRFADKRTAEAAREVSAGLDSAETQQLFQGVASGLDELVNRSLDRLANAQAHGLQPKKRSLGAAERDEFLRAAWRAMVAGEAGIEARRLVFLSTSAARTSLWCRSTLGRGEGSERSPRRRPTGERTSRCFRA